MKQSTIAIIIAFIIVGGVGIYTLMGSVSEESQSVTDSKVSVTTTKDDDSMKPEESQKTIVESAIEAGDFTTLVAAVQAAGLVDTLSSEGPFTVFAPTDAAFAKLPAGTVEALLQDKEALTNILTYHVVPGKVMASDVVKLTEAKTVQGDTVAIKVTDQGVMINDSMVVTTDIVTSNGVIHVIDTVLLPN